MRFALLALAIVSHLPGEQPSPSAEQLFNAGRYSEAAEQFSKLTADRPSDPGAWYGLGKSWAALGAQSYRSLLKTSPATSSYVLTVKADALMHRNQYRQAFPLLLQAVKADPYLTSAHSALAEIYRSAGHRDWAKQEEDLIRAVPCEEYRLACKALAGRYLELVSESEGASTEEALYWRGEAYTSLSYEAFGKLLDLPPSAELYRFKAGIHYEAGDFGRVVTELRRAVQLAPQDRSLQRELAMALGAAHDYSAALELASRLLKDEPDSPELNALVGDVLLNEQKASESIPYLRKSAKLDPKNLTTKSSLGKALMQTGNYRQALPNLEAASPIDQDGSIDYQLAIAYRQSGKTKLAAEAMARYRTHSKQAVIEPEPPITAPQ